MKPGFDVNYTQKMTASTKDIASVKFLPQGALIQEFNVGGHNIVLGFPSAKPYTYLNAPFFGETIGRYANRIKDGLIRDLNGRSYQLAQNNASNSLHGGSIGWGKRTFDGPHLIKRNGCETVQFIYVSPDGEEGYPGTVELRVWYSTSEREEDGLQKFVLDMEYEAELIGDECDETAINVTNHSYFNLSGGPTIKGTEVNLSSNQFLPVDSMDIPLGHIESWPGIRANETFVLGDQEPDIDHCWVADADPKSIPVDTRERQLARLVSMSHPNTKVHMDIFSTEPAFQFYLGKHISVPQSEYGPALGPRSGLCIEPSRYVDAINRPEWRSMSVLRRGEKFGSKTRYVAWKAVAN